jgi:pyrroloquinoline quinone (PQQ) biosynthesis protein C
MGVLGIDRQATLRRLPPPEIAALIGSQYYWILHAHPVAVMAYLAVLEGSPPKVETLDGLVAEHGIPEAALATFYKHSQLDISHGEEVFRLIDELPLSAEQTALLGLSAVNVVEHLSLTIEALLGAFGHGDN